MLQLYPSNKTEALAYLIAEIIERQPLTNIFAEEIILIQSQGMGTWLQQEMSSHSGISALVKCQMPASFIWKLAESLMPEDLHIPIFEKANARWEIFRRLPDKLDDANYLSLKNYLHGQQAQSTSSTPDEQAVTQQKTLFELSSVIADVFDAYQNYRPDWLELWESGRTILDSSQSSLAELEAWQSDLWCSLYPEIPQDQRQHRSKLFSKLINVLKHPSDEVKQKLPERIFIFGLSALPPQWLPVMSALSKHVDIHFMVHNPCEYYWGDVLNPTQQLRLEKALVDKGVSLETAAETFLEGNPLLASWGKLGRDYISLLTDSHDVEEAPTSFYDDSLQTNETQATALSCIQYDILKLQRSQTALSIKDDSLRFASCHSHLREVEALHDYLLSLLNSHPEIKPKDIIVMMPDVQDFASLIDAVFSRPAYDKFGQAQYLPYGISDQQLSLDQPLLDSLSSLLNLSRSRITGPEVLDLLEIPAIRSRFDISESEMEDIKAWIHHLNIRWGLSESHRDHILQTAGSGEGNTWLSAAQRLLAGYIFGQETIYQKYDSQCLAFPQRSPERQVLTGKLLHFLDVITSSIHLQSKQFTLQAWLSELTRLWQAWLDFEQVSEDIQSLLHRFESDIQKEILHTGFDQPVSFSVISSVLQTQIENQRVSQRFLAGRINFCTLMPMRSIPFKVVCMLGLNEGAYPRPIQGQSFDLLTRMPARIGDRSRREDDRYLFLEAICSARSHLYISYCGRDIQDNSERYPSILVSELQSYCVETFKLDECEFEENETILNYFLLEHYLQPFHTDYYHANAQSVPADSRKQISLSKTFATEWLALLNPKEGVEQQDLEAKKSLSEDEEQFDFFVQSPNSTDIEIDFDRLLNCISHPLRYYYQTTLQVNLNEFVEEISVSEPFAIQGLSAYELKKDMAQNWFADHQSDELSPELKLYWQLAGKLPRAPLDEFYINNIQSSLKPMYDYIRHEVSDNSRYNDVEVSVGKYRISGSLLSQGNQLVELALSKNSASVFFGFWLKHIIWSLFCLEHKTGNSLAQESRLIGPEQEIILPALSLEQARDYALECCELFESASVRPYVFFSKASYSLLFESESKAKNAFEGNQNYPGENQDAYWQRYCILNKETGLLNPDIMPELEDTVLYQQVASIKELIQIKKLELDKDLASAKEISS